MPDKPVNAAVDGEPSMDTPTTKKALGDSAPQRPVDAPGAVPRGHMASTWHKDTNRLSLLLQNPIRVCLALLFIPHHACHAHTTVRF